MGRKSLKPGISAVKIATRFNAAQCAGKFRNLLFAGNPNRLPSPGKHIVGRCMRDFSPVLQRLTKVTETQSCAIEVHHYPRASVFTDGRVRSFCVAIAVTTMFVSISRWLAYPANRR
jgi:hypothetical protein